MNGQKTMENRLYTTGEFAKLCGVKKQTLFHYDDIDLLKPARVDTNGYRRYSYDQYQDFLLISCLKEAGMSLKEIRDYLNEPDKSKRERTVELRIAALDQRIAYLMHVRKILSSTFSSMGEVIGSAEGNENEIRLENRPETELWASPRLDLLEDKELVEKVAEIVKTAEPCAVCLASEDIMDRTFDRQRHLLLQKELVSEETAVLLGLEAFTQPAGRYGVTDQQPGESPADAYERLIMTMEQFNEVSGEYFYEEYPLSASSESVAPLTIAVQLIPRNGNDGLPH